MYESFYQLTGKPFKIVPNPAALFLSERYENALTYLEYGLTEKAGFIVLTGEIGIGKTTLIRYLLNKLESEMDVAVIFNTNVNSDQILKLILTEFDLPVSDGDKTRDLDTLYQFLIERYRLEKQVLLIIDEAQNLSREALEEVRMLSNLQSDDEILLQILIAGQPELKKKLKKPELLQFSQRVAVSYHLSPLTYKESCDYIAHRLKAVNGSPDLFLPEAMELIYDFSNGIPRTINLISDACLVYGFADEIEQIGPYIVQQVIDDKGGMGIMTGDWGEEDLVRSLQKDSASQTSTEDESADSTMRQTDIVYRELNQKITALERRIAILEQKLADERNRADRKIERIQNGLIKKLFRMLLDERKEKIRMVKDPGKLLNAKSRMEKPAVRKKK